MSNTSRKEIIIAVIIGLASGVLAAYLLYSFRKKPVSLNKAKVSQTIIEKVTPKKALVSKVEHLIIDSPLNNSLTDKEVVEITGQAPLNSTIIISSEEADEAIELKQQNYFKTDITLIPGENLINVTDILPNGQVETSLLTLIFQKE